MGQAGVRFSMEDPKSYVDSNIIGSFNILEMCKTFRLNICYLVQPHLFMEIVL